MALPGIRSDSAARNHKANPKTVYLLGGFGGAAPVGRFPAGLRIEPAGERWWLPTWSYVRLVRTKRALYGKGGFTAQSRWMAGNHLWQAHALQPVRIRHASAG